jgi:hypothetical protein
VSKWLFVTHKWGDAVPGSGESVTIPHLLDTFEEWGGGQHEVVWTDETRASGLNLEQEVQRVAREFEPDVIAYTPIPALHLLAQNMPPDKMAYGRAAIVTFIFDLADRQVRRLTLPYANHSDLCINVDGERKRIGLRFRSLWPARTSRAARPKDIGVSFLGARRNYADRIAALNLLEAEGVSVVVFGGRDEARLSFDEYFDILDRSLITLNFSKTPSGLSQIKARVFEALSCGCCLVADADTVTRRYLTEGGDYVAWNHVRELPPLIRGLLQNPDQAARIAANGRRTFEERYSAACFWETVMSALKERPAPAARFLHWLGSLASRL